MAAACGVKDGGVGEAGVGVGQSHGNQNFFEMSQQICQHE